MATAVMSKEAARLEILLLDAESSSAAFDDVMIGAAKRGIPPEIITRLKTIWGYTRRLGDEVVEVGKIVVLKIIEFLNAHPGMVWGVVVGAALAVLASSVPLLGTLLAPLLIAVGAIAGLAIDADVSPTDPRAAIFAAGKAFFELFVNVIRALADHFSA